MISLLTRYTECPRGGEPRAATQVPRCGRIDGAIAPTSIFCGGGRPDSRFWLPIQPTPRDNAPQRTRWGWVQGISRPNWASSARTATCYFAVTAFQIPMIIVNAMICHLGIVFCYLKPLLGGVFEHQW